ncbi:grasp-with-spasm system ATP-grasp peptide maturase [Pedobacter aquatilis]|uniref:grasp-with-spasm system ATP-grasp peptide maturase n=1 Tax=Pedobacter aquatilis TaxID=351343 RepID=UPI00292FCDF2|nr:grasp-with-spasm system ATP-grasp peptide maturase [Pedobacter aquatilis]
MILILSSHLEPTTNEVVMWLNKMKKSYIRVNEEEIFEIKIIKKKFFLESNINSFYLDDISSIWYRRGGGLKFNRERYNNEAIDRNMNEAFYWLEDYVIKKLESKKHINKQSNSNLNKLLVLEEAKNAGLNVPEYFLAENTDDVIINKMITKSFTENIILDAVDERYDGILYTAVISKPEKDSFFPTFFQQKIEKEYEIRSFYLNGIIWSTAIISQNDMQTTIDHRKYNEHNPNRNIPYKLPVETENKLNNLFMTLDVNCGSADFIKGKDGKFYFLEINPLGQFLGLSAICNYSLEKEIAEFL